MPKKLTREETKKKIEDILHNEAPDDLDIFVLIYNGNEKGKQDVEYMGNGCPACAVNVIFEGAVQGRFQHNGPEPPQVDKKDLN